MTADELELEPPIRGCVAAKLTSQECWRECCIQGEDFTWTKVTGSILCCPEFVEDWKRVNDKDDCLIVLAEWETRKIFDVHRTA